LVVATLTRRDIDKAIREAEKDGVKARLRVSDYLFLNIKPPRSAGLTVRASWSCAFTFNSKARDMGLGSYPDVGLLEAVEARDKARALIRAGVDPIADRQANRKPPKRKPTFGETADVLIKEKESGWKHPSTAAMWRRTLRDQCADLRALPVGEIDTEAVLDALKDALKRSGGSIVVRNRTRAVIETVLDAAKVKGHRAGENPAAWRGNLALLLPKAKSSGHYPAMDYTEIPDFIRRLRIEANVSRASIALEFIILTAVRTREALEARWSEIDLAQRIWTIPATRMKSDREHRVPLSSRAVEIIEQMEKVRCSEYVFPGQNRDMPFGHSALPDLLKRLKAEGVTVHGFRSSFRDWCGEETATPREVAEAALAHAVGSSTERSYRRGDALEKRRALMNAWADYIEGRQADKVVALRAG
jgi:integrase